MLVDEESNLGGRCVRLMRVFEAGEKERVKYPGKEETKKGEKRR